MYLPNLPPGFVEVTRNERTRPRKYIQCTHQIISRNGKTYQCQFAKRSDNLKGKDLNIALQHIHFNSDLTQYFQKEIDTKDEPKTVLSDQLARFTGKFNLPLESVVSNSMKKVLLTTIKLAREFPAIPAEQLLPSLNRKSFTKTLIQSGLSIYKDIIEQYKKLKYISISVDAGKLGPHNYFDVLLCNALIELKPIIFRAFSHFHGNSFDYIEKLSQVIENLKSIGFTIAGIVSDNLRVQCSSISIVIAQNDPQFFHIRCSAHSLHLGIDDAFRSDPALKSLLNSLSNFCIFMNHKDVLSKIKMSTPKRCLTRWTNIFDICSFIMKHYGKYFDFIENQENFSLESLTNSYAIEVMKQSITFIAPLFFLLLLPFKILSDKLESDRFTVGFVYGFERTACIQLEQLAVQIPQINQNAREFIATISKRLSKSESGLLEFLSFSLTPQGHEIAKKIINKEDALQDLAENFPIDLTPFNEHIEICKAKLNNADETPVLNEALEHQIQKENKSRGHQESIAEKREALRKESLFYEIKEQFIIHNLDYNEYRNAIHENALEEFDESDDEEQTERSSEEDVYGLIAEEEETDETEEPEDPLEEIMNQEIDDEFSTVREAMDSETFLPREFCLTEIEDEIITLGEKMGFDGEKAVISYTRWMSPNGLPRAMLVNSENESILNFWDFMEKDPDFHDLSILAKMILTNPASEAMVERMFWRQRRILTESRNRTGKSLAFSRIVLMTAEDL